MEGILFRVDGGKIWGLSFGHIFRCLALAGELKSRLGLSCRFLMKDIPAGIEVVRRRGFAVVTLPANAAPEAEAAAILAHPETTFVADLPEPNPALIAHIERQGRFAAVFDEKGSIPEATLVVDGRIGVPPSRDNRRLAGPAYCVLGPEFDHSRRATTRGPGRRALMTFGGSDPAGLTLRVARALAARARGIEIAIVLGPGYGESDELTGMAAKSEGAIVLIRDVSDMAGVMLESDAALSAAGRTAYELAATGTPAVLAPSIAHEKPVARALAQAGAAVVAEVENDRDAETAAGMLLALLSDSARREAMRRAGMALVDGQGRRRVADAIATLGKSQGTLPDSRQRATS